MLINNSVKKLSNLRFELFWVIIWKDVVINYVNNWYCYMYESNMKRYCV